VREAPRIRGGVGVRLVSLFFGLPLIAAAIDAQIESRLGLAPWDVLHQGISRHSVLTIGRASIVVGLAMMVVAWILGQPPGFGTLANAVVIGWLIDVFGGIGWVQRLSDSPVGVRALLVASGVVLFAIASAFYIGAAFGAGPRDSTMPALSRRTGQRIAVVRACLEITALAAGWALGGTAGVGTAAAAILVGPAVEAAFWLAVRAGLARPAPAAIDVSPAVLGPAE
jgi:uncharacterized membrane protein YczE